MTLPMNRRDALKVGLLGTAGVLAACKGGAGDVRRTATGVLSGDDQALAEAIADTLLPTTPSSPGATMNLLLTDCYDAEAQDKVVRGLDEFRTACRSSAGDDFTALPAARREPLLRTLAATAHAAGDAHWYHLVRELALRAYFSSEI